jgi:hypothetical protein
VDSSTGPIVLYDNNNQVSVGETEGYGHTLRHGTLCLICQRPDLNEVNLMRARDLMTYKQISDIKKISVDTLDLHFRNHFIVRESRQKFLDIKEHGNPNAISLIAKIFEGELDINAGARGVLESKAERLTYIRSRMHVLTDRQEISEPDEVAIEELRDLNRLAEDIENSILKAWQIVDKKMFPFKKEVLQDAIIEYKLDVAVKTLEKVQLALMGIEIEEPDSRDLIFKIRKRLASLFNQIEEEILKTGGVITPKVVNHNDTDYK